MTTEASFKIIYQRIIRTLFFLLTIIVIGSGGYLLLAPEKATVLDAVYMTAITLTTIGYEEVIDLSDNPAGRIYTIVLAFTGIGIYTYLATNLAALMVEGELRNIFLQRRMNRMINKLENHFLICGTGRVGLQVMHELNATERSFVFADINEHKVNKLRDEFRNHPGIAGNCTHNSILESMGIHQAKGIFVCTNDDNVNLVICLSARQLNPNIRIISSCKSPDFEQKIEAVGANRVISPYEIGGIRMANDMFKPDFVDFLDRMRSESSYNIRLEEIHISNKFETTTLGDILSDHFEYTMVLAVRIEDSWHFAPKKHTLMKGANLIVVMTSPQERKRLKELLQE
ncbi:potassium channel protein [Algivirga pacifica]|uniref:Potassium channel protein n=1 Tax=Algivirga pacifica TaxID=1162670 RepID=A0ABP9D966_9BACT